MADATFGFLLQDLNQLLVYNADLISGVKHEVESLYRQLTLFKAFLEDSTKKRGDNAILKVRVRQIRHVVHEAEDVIDTFVRNASLRRTRSRLSNFAHSIDYTTKLRTVAKEIQAIRKRVDEIYRNESFGIGLIRHPGEKSDRESPEKKVPVVEEENVVGFDQEAENLVARLNGAKTELEVVSVIGMGGLGKTTLARKVFTNPGIVREFPKKGWGYVSQEYSRKEVFLDILISMDVVTDEMYKWSGERLAKTLCAHLQSVRYLVVMDDVCTKEAWNDLKMVFPRNNNRSRILLTSRNTAIINANRGSRPPHLRFLTNDESWELLQKKVFPDERCPSELKDLGKKIAEDCGGLPLAIGEIAELLLKDPKKCEWWETLAKSVSSYVARDPTKCMDILALSYEHLPYHLKACFLYFGVFPKDYEIPVWKLILLWVAEGFIQQVGQTSLEATAEEQLEDLVDRNLILVEKRRSNGGIKTCRVHGMLRGLCLREAEDEKFFQEIKGIVPVSCSSSSPSLNIYRRLCIHSRISEDISSIPSCPHVRSFLCHAVEQVEAGNTSFIHKTFKLLRVLDMMSISLSLFPVKIKKLVRLRYIALQGNFDILPAPISNLWNLQTIIIHTTSPTLEVEANIWKMSQLRHFITNASSRLCSPSAEAGESGEEPLVMNNLQTLSTISPESCTQDILVRTPNLKKLGIRGELAILMEEMEGSNLFDNLAKLDQLVTLKLLNYTITRPPPGDLPQMYKFPPNLKNLTLADTLLGWEQMSTLGILPKLEVLKLKDNAFQGIRWEVQDGGFRLLKFLQIGRTDLVHWEASSHHFPILHHLILKHCESLVAVPSGLGDVAALHRIELHHSSPTAVASVRQIQSQELAINRLELLIYPPGQ